LNPTDPESIPEGLINALSAYTSLVSPVPSASVSGSASHAARLRAQMRADALLPLSSRLGDDEDNASIDEAPAAAEDFPQDVIEEAVYFLRLGVSGLL